MFKAKLLVVLTCVVFSLVACAAGPRSAGEQRDSMAPANKPAYNVSPETAGEAKPAAEAQVSLDEAAKSRSEPAPEKPVERKIIRNADLQMESEAPEEGQRKITAIAESKGGFVVESTQSSSDVKLNTRDTVTMTARVPAEKFNEALDEIRKTADRVISETVKGQDVTEEFIDIEARLKAKKALEEQFLEIMKRSNSVQDALNIQRELANVRGEIEQIEGRKRFLENQSSFSTIKVSVQTPTAISGKSRGFFYRLTDAISAGLDGASIFLFVFVTALIALLPFLILIVLPILLVALYWRKRQAKLRSKPRNMEEVVREELKEQ